jgi:hypothetical protein
MKCFRLLAAMLTAVAVAALLPPAPAAAQVIDIAWSPDDAFVRELSVAPGKFAELCGESKVGHAVQWHFSASHVMDFNIHCEEGGEMAELIERWPWIALHPPGVRVRCADCAPVATA